MRQAASIKTKGERTMAKRQRITCKHCGKPIRFVYSDGKYIPVNKAPVYIKPTYNCSDVYYRGNGTKVTGIPDSEVGTLCYEPHICMKKAEVV